MNIVTKTIDYLKASRVELKKVVWPSRREIIQHTALVIGVSIGVAFFLGGIDYILTLLIETFIIK